MGKFVFVVDDPENGDVLWVTDGTAAGTKRIADVNPDGLDMSDLPFAPVAVGGKLLFANNNEQGASLWVTDGTERGTKIVTSVDAGPLDYAQGISELTSIGGKLAAFLVTPSDTQAPLEIWVTDGTAKGTKALQEIKVSQSNTQSIVTQVGEKIFFTSGPDLWISDGTKAGTTNLGAVLPSVDPFNFEFQVLGNKLLFSGSINGDPELWISDGTVAGTKQLADPTNVEEPEFVATIGKKTLFFGESAVGRELWVTDGTTAGTRLVKDMNEGAGGSFAADQFAFGDKALFWRTDEDSFRPKLWVSAGTAAGTQLLSDEIQYPAVEGPAFAMIGDKVVFAGEDFTNDGEVWVTDGTPAGTTRLTSNLFEATPKNFVSLGDGRALFSWNDGFKGEELWITDGTAAGTKLLSDIDPNGSSSPREFAGFPNSPPTDVTLSKTTIAENAKKGAVVGVLGAVDPDAGDSFTFELAKPSAAFEIRNDKLVVKNGLLLDFEQGKTATVSIEVTDAAGETVTKSIKIGITNVDPERVTGDQGANKIFGGAKADTLNGRGGNDTLNGGAGNDTLDGGAGGDLMIGGKGADVFVVDSAADRITEAANGGVDEVRASIDYTLGRQLENLTLTGGKAIDGTGNAGANEIVGNAKANVLDGGLGSDTLEGGKGRDVFVFSTKLGRSNVDVIEDYSVRDDTIHLARDVFVGIGRGVLDRDAFVIGAAATDAKDRIIYDDQTGALFFDRDGSRGKFDAVKFAELDAGLKLTASEFSIV